MARLVPDTRTRLALDELGGVSLSGGPASARVEDMATGSVTEVVPSGGLFEIPAPGCPRLLRVTWEVSGVEVSAEADVVSCQPCGISDIVSYRSEQYELRCSDDEAFEARARAVEVIERECRRTIQPVMRLGWVDRGCRARTMVMGEDGPAVDLMRVVSARLPDGTAAPVRQLRPGSLFLDVSRMRPGEMAEVAYVCGEPMAPDAKSAVVALAAWHLTPRTEPENATSSSTELGVMSFVTAGVSGAATSLPEVNAYIRRHALQRPVVA